jgi:hypothetical protein
MDAERWKRVDDLLQSALEVAPDQQEAFLRQQNAGRIVLCCRRSSRCCSPQAGELPGVRIDPRRKSGAPWGRRRAMAALSRLHSTCASDHLG